MVVNNGPQEKLLGQFRNKMIRRNLFDTKFQHLTKVKFNILSIILGEIRSRPMPEYPWNNMYTGLYVAILKFD